MNWAVEANRAQAWADLQGSLIEHDVKDLEFEIPHDQNDDLNRIVLLGVGHWDKFMISLRTACAQRIGGADRANAQDTQTIYAMHQQLATAYRDLLSNHRCYTRDELRRFFGYQVPHDEQGEGSQSGSNHPPDNSSFRVRQPSQPYIPASPRLSQRSVDDQQSFRSAQQQPAGQQQQLFRSYDDGSGAAPVYQPATAPQHPAYNAGFDGSGQSRFVEVTPQVAAQPVTGLSTAGSSTTGFPVLTPTQLGLATPIGAARSADTAPAQPGARSATIPAQPGVTPATPAQPGSQFAQ
jgi:hypothetical protein